MGTAFIGIDPGLEGAVVGVSVAGQVFCEDTPILHTENSAGKARRIYDEVAMAICLGKIEGKLRLLPNCFDVHVVIEQVHAMPKQGVASSFTFGMGYGIWLGIIAALGFASTRVTPQRWKKEVLADGPKTDQAVIAFASRLYPTYSPELKTQRGRLLLGRADALLIAHWARQRAK